MKNFLMNNDPGIICFTHCGCSIFHINLPKICPNCKESLENNVNNIPFRIPFPFVRAEQTTCAIILKPSIGDFLRCYDVNTDLHIGITTSTGIIFEYDSKGLCNADKNQWNESLVVYQLKENSWIHRWDSTLKKLNDKIYFSQKKYDENSFNCYSFVLTFIQSLQYKDVTQYAISKEVFCEKLIIPRLTVAYEYVCLFRSISTNGFFIRRLKGKSCSVLQKERLTLNFWNQNSLSWVCEEIFEDNEGSHFLWRNTMI